MTLKQHHLKALIAAAEHGGIHAAARAIHLTQPAVTKAIKDLETEVGLPLLDRQSRGVSLTSEGRVLLARAQLIVRELERAEEELAHIKGLREGRLVIAVTPLAGLTILPKAFSLFRGAWPDIKLEFVESTSDQLYDQLRQGQVDFAIGSANDPSDDLPARRDVLFTLPTAFGVRRDSPLAQARSLSDLAEAEWLHADISGQFPTFLGELFASQGLRTPKRLTRCTSQALLHSLAMQNDVVFFWSLFAIGMPELRQRFVSLPLGLETPRLSMSLLVREDRLLTRPAEYFIRCIREVATTEWTDVADQEEATKPNAP